MTHATASRPNRGAVILAGQHGDEPLGISLANKVLSCLDCGFPISLELLWVPCANPNGFIDGIRETSFAGQDMNRAWGTGVFPHEHVISDFITKWRGRCVAIDCHESRFNNHRIYGDPESSFARRLRTAGYTGEIIQDKIAGSFEQWAEELGASAFTAEATHEGFFGTAFAINDALYAWCNDAVCQA